MNLLRKLIPRAEKEPETTHDDRTPCEEFVSNVHDVILTAQQQVWKMTSDIYDLDEEIERLLNKRQDIVEKRLALNLAINEQRKVLGLDEITVEELDEEMRPAEDTTYALEP